MEKDQFNLVFREYAKTLSLKETERNFISKIYQSFLDLLGKNNCLQIGSYPRFTAIRPLHDLDILYILGDWVENNCNPKEALENLLEKIEKDYEYENYEIKKSSQSHSVTVSFKNNSEEIFAVDIIPAYIFGQNESKEDIYKVPEIFQKKRGMQRNEFYQKLQQEYTEMAWITTDPRGYTQMAEQENKRNSDFRKTVKTIKKWKNLCKEQDKDFSLKSFHIEQVITKYFKETSELTIFDGIFKFFCEIPQIIKDRQIKDKADNQRYIDEYLNDLTNEQKEKIRCARNGFLIKLERFKERDTIKELLAPHPYKRTGDSEEFLFDKNIPIFIENYNFQIDGFIQKKDGFRHGWLSELANKIGVAQNRQIEFQITRDIQKDYTMWKVQNDKTSEEVLNTNHTRGEITKDSTLRNPESTQYTGKHYVKCFAIKNDVCIAKSRVNVNID